MANSKTYAWNFRLVQNNGKEGVLVLRAISQDSIGVLFLNKGQFEFWSGGRIALRTKSIKELFEVIDRIEGET